MVCLYCSGVVLLIGGSCVRADWRQVSAPTCLGWH